ncbi:MAG: class I mannose-6-phosphate isomerase [Elusimicrobiota bacterium]|jgi:mannose-6-phosphate isomerase|nr:class I mannose-6-phosphate isomerase [Elusimicrobiota bacterium]
MYPMIFTPIAKQTIWGGNNLRREFNKPFKADNIGESWELSCVKNNISIIANGKFAGKPLDEILNNFGLEILGKKVFKAANGKFPLLFKFIDAQKDLSIQVHPNDALAKARHDSFGKTEMWYVLSAQKGSKLYSGFKKKIDEKTYKELVANSKITDVLAQYEVKAGDSFFIDAGQVHAIGAGIVIAEIQQTSDITYRIFDYDRLDSNGKKRELHTDLAALAINFNIKDNYKTEYTPKENEPVNIACCPYFTVNFISLKASKTLNRNLADQESFVVYMCADGDIELSCGKYKQDLEKGATVLVPACLANDINLSAKDDSAVLEVYV